MDGLEAINPLEVSGWQQQYRIDTDPERVPAALVRGQDGRPLTITVPIRGRDVSAQIWRVAVGRVPPFLLDADRPETGRLERWITSQLYVGDPITRLSQYALLGVGGVRALAALGIEPGLVHLNDRVRDLPPGGGDRPGRGLVAELGVDPEVLLRLGAFTSLLTTLSRVTGDRWVSSHSRRVTIQLPVQTSPQEFTIRH